MTRVLSESSAAWVGVGGLRQRLVSILLLGRIQGPNMQLQFTVAHYYTNQTDERLRWLRSITQDHLGPGTDDMLVTAQCFCLQVKFSYFQRFVFFIIMKACYKVLYI